MSEKPFETGLTIHIRKVETGEVRRYHYSSDGFPGWDGGFEYMFRDGNYSCDCNRELFFGYAIGLDPDATEIECTDGRFVIDKIETPDGKVVYSETADSATMRCCVCGAVHDGAGDYKGDKNPKYANDPVYVAIHKAFMDFWTTLHGEQSPQLWCPDCRFLRTT